LKNKTIYCPVCHTVAKRGSIRYNTITPDYGITWRIGEAYQYCICPECNNKWESKE
jgi:hypothetical protein